MTSGDVGLLVMAAGDVDVLGVVGNAVGAFVVADGVAEGVFVGIFVGVEVGIVVVGEGGGNVGFAEGVPVGEPDLITISPLSVSLNTLPSTVPYLISGQVVVEH